MKQPQFTEKSVAKVQNKLCRIARGFLLSIIQPANGSFFGCKYLQFIIAEFVMALNKQCQSGFNRIVMDYCVAYGFINFVQSHKPLNYCRQILNSKGNPGF